MHVRHIFHLVGGSGWVAKGPGFWGETWGSSSTETWLKSPPCLTHLTGANITFVSPTMVRTMLYRILKILADLPSGRDFFLPAPPKKKTFAIIMQRELWKPLTFNLLPNWLGFIQRMLGYNLFSVICFSLAFWVFSERCPRRSRCGGGPGAAPYLEGKTLV